MPECLKSLLDRSMCINFMSLVLYNQCHHHLVITVRIVVRTGARVNEKDGMDKRQERGPHHYSHGA